MRKLLVTRIATAYCAVYRPLAFRSRSALGPQAMLLAREASVGAGEGRMAMAEAPGAGDEVAGCVKERWRGSAGKCGCEAGVQTANHVPDSNFDSDWPV